MPEEKKDKIEIFSFSLRIIMSFQYWYGQNTNNALLSSYLWILLQFVIYFIMDISCLH